MLTPAPMKRAGPRIVMFEAIDGSKCASVNWKSPAISMIVSRSDGFWLASSIARLRPSTSPFVTSRNLLL